MISPYGYPVETPNLQRLAEGGVVFRQAFSCGPTCSPSRAGLLTGETPHQAGMLGLAHLGWGLRHPERYLPSFLRSHGYESVLAGVQHVAHFEEKDVWRKLGYSASCEFPSDGKGDRSLYDWDRRIAEGASKWLKDSSSSRKPFFLDCGFLLPHRPFRQADPKRGISEDARYIRPPAYLPDTPEIRTDMADFNASVKGMDECTGIVLDALEKAGLAGDTLVVATTDHGIAFPDMKCNLTDQGAGIYLILRGPGFRNGQVCDALVSHLDIYPTICRLAGIASPEWVQGRDLRPLTDGTTDRIREEIFSEVTYHASYEPMRSVRTTRWKYIRRFDPEWKKPVLPNCDDGPSKQVWLDHGWASVSREGEELYDLVFDPLERRNLAQDPAMEPVCSELSRKLAGWMQATEDPLLDGPVPLSPEGKMLPVDSLKVDNGVWGRKKFSDDGEGG
jgi:arylsulfatase A-like enzyme